MLRGDTTLLEQVFREAPEEASILVLSSEDFENALADERLAERISGQFASLGVEDVHYAVVTRKPDDYFFSIFAEMSKHKVVLDLLSVFDEVMRTGKLTVPMDPEAYKGVPGGWQFIFDYSRYIEQFRTIVKKPVHVFPFEDSPDFPGSDILKLVGGDAGQAIDVSMPEPADLEKYRNTRLTKKDIIRKYTRTLVSNLDYTDEQIRTIRKEVARKVNNEELEADIRKALLARFP
ncbi:hypothetical protein [Coralliovum pocilloporae]|uniref:hypothetical protein n=1 Tax=Coralliovum pocilloporae TaxID=3066369 RepID=UPI0033077199